MSGNGANSLMPMASGAMQGAAMGTMVAPGIGTAVGAGVGGGLPMISGMMGGDQQQQPQQQMQPMQGTDIGMQRGALSDYLTSLGKPYMSGI